MLAQIKNLRDLVEKSMHENWKLGLAEGKTDTWYGKEVQELHNKVQEAFSELENSVTTNSEQIVLPRQIAEEIQDSLMQNCGGRCNSEYNPCWEFELAAKLQLALDGEHDKLVLVTDASEDDDENEDSALVYAQQIANYIWRNHYKAKSPKFEVLDTLDGVLSQIDNMVAGLSKNSLTQPEKKLRAQEIQLAPEQKKLLSVSGPVDLGPPIIEEIKNTLTMALDSLKECYPRLSDYSFGPGQGLAEHKRSVTIKRLSGTIKLIS